jgi:hypothetical protein
MNREFDFAIDVRVQLPDKFEGFASHSCPDCNKPMAYAKPTPNNNPWDGKDFYICLSCGVSYPSNKFA